MADWHEDTIAAISTAPAPSGIGIVRISGPDAFEVADRIFRRSRKCAADPSYQEKYLSAQKANTVHHGYICDGRDIIDEVLAVLFRAPHSYTGEDTVEFDCHGGMLTTRKILELAVHRGARLAEPGEFSRRAFLNGRMDLSQAEAVMDVISAQNDRALHSAERQLEGSLSEEIHNIRQTLLHETARIEAALDDPEHMSLDGYAPVITKIINTQKKKIERLIDSAAYGRFIREGLKTVITGKPNAGKSSLLNYMLGRDKAIVTEIAGTTRDILEETVNMRGITLRLLDTAGIREADDTIEKIGVERAAEQVQDADLVLYVVDSSVNLDDNDRKILSMIRGRQVIVILNKSDLESVVTEEDLREFLRKNAAENKAVAENSDVKNAVAENSDVKNAEVYKNSDNVAMSGYSDSMDRDMYPIIQMSSKNRTGMEELENQIERMFFSGKIGQDDQVCITNERHRAALEDADQSLSLVLNSIEDGMPEDFWSIDLMGACDALGKITGETAGEDLVNEIFSSFCMGK